MTRRTRLIATGIAITALLSFANLALAQGTTRSADRSVTSQSKAAELEDEITRASLEYEAARIAPATTVAPGAIGAAWAQAQSLPVAGTAWTELTTKPYDSDDPRYRDPVISNSGGGNGLVTGRMTALAVDGSIVYAGGADGGVWVSTNGGNSFTPVFDGQASLSIGAIGVAPDHSAWVGTGENNTAFENYRGAGVFRSSDTGASWTKVGGDELDGTTIGKLAFDGIGGVYAATSRGLFKHSATTLAGAWQKMFDAATFGYQAIPYGLSIVNDVVVRPHTGGQYVVANMSWRNGTAYDGFYVSTDAGTHWARTTATGAIVDNDLGSTSFAYSADGSTLYAVVQSPFQISHFTQSGGTTLQGVFVSPSGSASGPWNKIAEGRKLATSGSALFNYFIGYNPGVQAWYNRFIGVDPADKDHVYLGLEEVFETQNGGKTWFAIGPYWNFGMPCSKNGLDSCPKTTHPDQHAVAFGNGTVFVGNDGGVWRRPTSVHTVEGWNDLNATLRTLQYYYAGSGKDPNGPGDGVWGGMQDNGASLLLQSGATMVQPFGGDGGDVIVDATNSRHAVNEYVDLDMFLTTNAGESDGTTHAWREISPSCFAFTYTPSPCDPNPRFIAPFRADIANPAHWVAGGQYVWDNGGKGWDTTCGASACDFKQAYNTGSGNSTTAIAVRGSVIYAGWCGPSGCNPKQSSTTGVGFRRGIATNYGGTWHELNLDAAGVPNRYVYSVAVDPADPATVYAVLGGFSRRWIDGGSIGHVFKSTDAGVHWTDISGNLPDAPADDILITGGKMVVAMDVGVFVAPIGSTAWSRLGTGLPNSAVNDLTLMSSGATIIAATHGRGLWSQPLP